MIQYKKGRIWLLTVCILSVLLTLPVSAADEHGSLTLQYVQEGQPFRLYHVADFAPDGSYRCRAGFDGLPVDWSGLTQPEDWYQLAADLDTMAVSCALPPDRTVLTDQAGVAVIEDMPCGLWLIGGDSHTADGQVYTVQPLLVSIPGTEGGGVPVYDRVLTISKYEVADLGEHVDLSVVKVWQDNRDAHRPRSIQVSLWQGEQKIQTVTLEAQNNWRHTWHELDTAHTWRVSEDSVPAGYRVSFDRQGNTVYITNTKPGTPPPLPPLPNTGVNWRYVACLVPLALVCLIIGVWRRKRSGD